MLRPVGARCMTTKQPYPEEFKIEAVKQITEQGHRVADVSARIGVIRPEAPATTGT